MPETFLAEWRTLGGIVGSMTPVRADDGRLALGEQIQARATTQYPESILDLGEYASIYQAKPGRFLQNITQVPDFRLTAELAKEFAAREDVPVDGVISIDPVALSYLLEATGPVDLPTGVTLTSANAAQFLLNDVYLDYPNADQQDLVFSAAAGAVFSALTSGDVDAGALLRALSRAGSEHRLYLWSAGPADADVLAGTTLAGAPPTNDADTARFGVYVNDGTGSKMDYYVTPDAHLDITGCGVGATPRTLTVQVTLTSNAPAGAATSLPDYITGGGANGVPPGIARVVGEVYLPEGFEVASSEITTESGFGGGMVGGRHVLSYSVDLKPGDTQTVTIEVTADTDIRDAEAWVPPHRRRRSPAGRARVVRPRRRRDPRLTRRAPRIVTRRKPQVGRPQFHSGEYPAAKHHPCAVSPAPSLRPPSSRHCPSARPSPLTPRRSTRRSTPASRMPPVPARATRSASRATTPRSARTRPSRSPSRERTAPARPSR
ncbi:MULTISPECIES: DUF4012 domain-containing protein [Microbacterium]|uniref:DUF4012 domain-containing protein n=1 Tax=Microbacterium TaxID=33882 RepID=UPI00344BE458